uniref:TLC domain-containing protein n=1 Tax=Peronospora matthiolae TaxID=2874970 RepID=A0AAV1V0S6_9STRA
MVVLHHNELDRFLWGSASVVGRSRSTDVAVYIQFAVVGCLGVAVILDYDKPESARLAAATAVQMIYLRSTELFVRLALFVSVIVLYGDIFVPICNFHKTGDVQLLPAAKLVLHCIWMWNMIRLLFTIFQSGAIPQRERKHRLASSTVKRSFVKL